MNKISTPEALLEQFIKMNKDDSVKQFVIPGTGKFTVVFQGEDAATVESDVVSDPELKKMIHESRQNYKDGNFSSTKDLLKSINPGDFSN